MNERRKQKLLDIIDQMKADVEALELCVKENHKSLARFRLHFIAANVEEATHLLTYVPKNKSSVAKKKGARRGSLRKMQTKESK